MSGLWKFNDDDDDDLQQDSDVFPPPSPVVVEEEEAPRPKRGRKPAAKPAGPRAKRRAASPLPTDLSLQRAPQPVPTLIISDDEDDLEVLPVPDTTRRGQAGASGTTPPLKPRGRSEPGKATVGNLDPATQKALAKEYELLSKLREVTKEETVISDDDLEILEPGPSAGGISPFGLRNMSSRLQSGSLGVGISGTSKLGTDSDELKKVPAPGSAAAPPCALERAPTDGELQRVPSGAAAEPAAEDRVRLKLAWHGGKDGHLMMRVVKTDPMSKMMEKFREVAKQRQLCKDPNKIKFVFDGDDLAKAPNQTPEDLDLEDDMMIDIKF